MGWKANLLVLVSVCGMGGYLWFQGEASVNQRPVPNILSKKLLDRPIWMAREVRIQRGELEPILLGLDHARKDYRIKDPVSDIASFATLESIFRIFDVAKVLEAWTEDELAARPELVNATQLETPQGLVEVRYEDETIKIEIGAETVRAGEIYLRVNGKIYRGPRNLLSAIQQNPDDLRERVLFTDLAIGPAKKVRVQRKVKGGMSVDAVERLPNVGFRIVEPKNLRANPAAVERLVREIGGLRIDQFVSGGAPLDPRAMSKDLIIEVAGDFGSDTLTVMDFGAAGLKGERQFLGTLEKRKIMFEIRSAGLLNMFRWIDVLRARHLVPLAESQMNRVELLPPGKDAKKVVLVRSAAKGYTMSSPRSGATSAVPVSELVYALANMTAKSFVDEIPEHAGLADGDDFLTVRVGSNPRGLNMTVVRIGRASPDGTVFARRADEPTGVKLPEDIVAKIRRPWTDFVSLLAIKVASHPFFVEATAPSGKEFFYVKKDEVWQELDSSRKSVDVDNLADSIRQLRAKAVLPRSAIPTGAKPVRVVVKGGTTRESSELISFDLFPYDDGEAKYSLFASDKGSTVVYQVRNPAFRALYDAWTK